MILSKINKEYFSENKEKTIKLLIILIIIITAAIVFFGRSSDGISISDEKTNNSIPSESEKSKETSSDTVICDVSGAVKNPKVVELKKGARIGDAIDSAGGLTTKADITNINRAAIVNDGDKILIPETGQQMDSNTNETVEDAFKADQNTEPASADPTGKINLNTADSQTLQQISGIGPVTAEKIIAFRNEKGRFTKIEQLMEISGIGEKTFAKMKDQVSI